jgi:hypothetical protein
MDRGEIGHPAPHGRSNGNERDPCRPSRAFRKTRTLTDEFRSGDNKNKRLRALLKPLRERYDLATTMNRWACEVRTCDDNSEPVNMSELIEAAKEVDVLRAPIDVPSHVGGDIA